MFNLNNTRHLNVPSNQPLLPETKIRLIPRILVIVNYQNFLYSLVDFLTENGFFVYGVSTPGMALDVLKCADFDLVICDNCPPDLCGLIISQQIRQFYPKVKFVLMSGLEDRPFKAEAKEKGILHIFRKPLNLDELLSSLHRLTRTD